MLDIALTIALAAIGIALALTAWRLLLGPTLPDRVLAIDTLYINIVALAILLGIRFDSQLAFEAGLVIALIGFVSTVALAKYLLRGDIVE